MEPDYMAVHLSKGEVVLVLLLAGGREEDDVVNALNEFQLDHTADQQAGELATFTASLTCLKVTELQPQGKTMRRSR